MQSIASRIAYVHRRNTYWSRGLTDKTNDFFQESEKKREPTFHRVPLCGSETDNALHLVHTAVCSLIHFSHPPPLFFFLFLTLLQSPEKDIEGMLIHDLNSILQLVVA